MIAYVPANRWEGIEGGYEYLLDPVTQEVKREADLYREYGAVYDLKKDSTRPADPQVRAKFLAGKIPDILKIVGSGGDGFKGNKPKYEIGYTWGEYKVVEYAKRPKGKAAGARYIIRCSCGRERIVRSYAIGLNQSCNVCRYRR